MTKYTPEIQYWRCPNCGQVHFGDAPPNDICAFCNDLTTWEPLSGVAFLNGRSHSSSKPDQSSPRQPQLPLFDEC